MNTLKSKTKQCCSKEYERLVRKIGSCEMESNTPGERHACYRKVARESGRQAKECMASGNI